MYMVFNTYFRPDPSVDITKLPIKLMIVQKSPNRGNFQSISFN